MSSEIDIINPIDYPGWDDLIQGNASDVFSNTTAWAKILSETYGYKPIYFTVFDKNRLATLLPVIEVNSIVTGLRGVSLPFTDYCNPIIDGEKQFHDLFNHIVTYGKKRSWKYFEFRNGERYLHDRMPASSYFGHTLDLSGDERKIYAACRESTRRNIRNATKHGVEVTMHESLNAVQEYYKLHCMTRKRQGVPPQAFTFFKKIHEHIISQKFGIIVLGAYKNRFIAGAVFLHRGRTAFFKYGASDLEKQNLRANNLVMWKAIKHYSERGFMNFCFGRTDLDNQGLRQFKAGWGAKENRINYYRYDLQKDTFVANRRHIRPLHNRIFRNMPVSVLQAAGRLLYRHMG